MTLYYDGERASAITGLNSTSMYHTILQIYFLPYHTYYESSEWCSLRHQCSSLYLISSYLPSCVRLLPSLLAAILSAHHHQYHHSKDASYDAAHQTTDDLPQQQHVTANPQSLPRHADWETALELLTSSDIDPANASNCRMHIMESI